LSLLPKDQTVKIAILRQIAPFLTGIETHSPPEGPVDVGRLDGVLGRIRFKMLDSSPSQRNVGRHLQTQMREVRSLIDDVREMFQRMEPIQLQANLKSFEARVIDDLNEKLNFLCEGVEARPMRIKDLPDSLLERFVGPTNLYLVRVYATKNIWEPRLLASFVRDLQSVDRDAVGDAVTLSIFTSAFREACIKASLYAVVLIFLFLIVTLRSLVVSLLALAPLFIGTVWTFGVMHILGIDLNLANSIFLPLILGAGVEYGIIVVQRWRQCTYESGQGECPSSTGLGVVLAGLSTTIGFGSLTISQHQGVHSLGVLTTIGSLAVLVAAVVFLPALIRVIPDYRLKVDEAIWYGVPACRHSGKEKETEQS